MFGFFKKKSGEIPEEQERLQKAAAREAERKEAPAIPEELRALGQKFLPEEFSILAVTGAGGFGGSRPQENGPWLAVLELTAWKEEDSEEPAHREKTQLVALADDKLMDYLRRRVRGDSVFQIMVRPSEDGKQFLMTELPQPEIDPEMKAILEEQKKPVSIWVPELGTFTLNRLVNWFEAEVEWLGQPARLDIDREEDWDACVEQAKAKGPGRKPTLPQIRREAYKWQKAGIDTLEAADAHLRRLTRLNQRGTELIQLLFGESRAPVAKEAEYLDQWIQKGFPDDLLLLARDRTIYHLQSFKWSYMNGILNRWQAKGLTTVEAVEAYDRSHRPAYAKPRPAAGPAPGPGRQGVVSREDVDRMFQELQPAGGDPRKEG